MELTPELKRRIAIFGGGAMVGTVFAIALFQWATSNDVSITPERPIRVVLSTCDLEAGDTVTAKCVEEKVVESRFAPPQTLEADDLDWHLGRKLEVDVPKGSAFRTVDFEPVKAEKAPDSGGNED